MIQFQHILRSTVSATAFTHLMDLPRTVKVRTFEAEGYMPAVAGATYISAKSDESHAASVFLDEGGAIVVHRRKRLGLFEKAAVRREIDRLQGMPQYVARP